MWEGIRQAEGLFLSSPDYDAMGAAGAFAVVGYLCHTLPSKQLADWSRHLTSGAFRTTSTAVGLIPDSVHSELYSLAVAAAASLVTACSCCCWHCCSARAADINGSEAPR